MMCITVIKIFLLFSNPSRLLFVLISSTVEIYDCLFQLLIHTSSQSHLGACLHELRSIHAIPAVVSLELFSCCISASARLTAWSPALLVPVVHWIVASASCVTITQNRLRLFAHSRAIWTKHIFNPTAGDGSTAVAFQPNCGVRQYHVTGHHIAV